VTVIVKRCADKPEFAEFTEHFCEECWTRYIKSSNNVESVMPSMSVGESTRAAMIEALLQNTEWKE
jgi:hypothetical protein